MSEKKQIQPQRTQEQNSNGTNSTSYTGKTSSDYGGSNQTSQQAERNSDMDSAAQHSAQDLNTMGFKNNNAKW